jgi:hypothetical protein
MLQVLSYNTQQTSNGAPSAGTLLTAGMSGDMMQYGWAGGRKEQRDPNAVVCQVSACSCALWGPFTHGPSHWVLLCWGRRDSWDIWLKISTQFISSSVCSANMRILT